MHEYKHFLFLREKLYGKKYNFQKFSKNVKMICVDSLSPINKVERKDTVQYVGLEAQ